MGRNGKMSDLETRMRAFVKKLGLPLDVCYAPDQNSPRHGEIKDNIIRVYDSDEETAWITLVHETSEYRFNAVTSIYRRIIDKLMEALADEVYSRKEDVLDRIIRDFHTWNERGRINE